MRHQKSGRKFSRTSAHRQAMFENMAASLIKHELIRTTLPKAKELRRVAEPLITMGKIDGVANRRLAFARLRDKQAVGKLFVELGPRYQARPGGYLRILKCGFRAGDNAPMAYVELVDRPAERRGRVSGLSNAPFAAETPARAGVFVWRPVVTPRVRRRTALGGSQRAAIMRTTPERDRIHCAGRFARSACLAFAVVRGIVGVRAVHAAAHGGLVPCPLCIFQRIAFTAVAWCS